MPITEHSMLHVPFPQTPSPWNSVHFVNWPPQYFFYSFFRMWRLASLSSLENNHNSSWPWIWWICITQVAIICYIPLGVLYKSETNIEDTLEHYQIYVPSLVSEKHIPEKQVQQRTLPIPIISSTMSRHWRAETKMATLLTVSGPFANTTAPVSSGYKIIIFQKSIFTGYVCCVSLYKSCPPQCSCTRELTIPTCSDIVFWMYISASEGTSQWITCQHLDSECPSQWLLMAMMTCM